METTFEQDRQEQKQMFYRENQHLIGDNLIESIRKVYGEETIEDANLIKTITDEITLYLQYSIDIMEATKRTDEIRQKILMIAEIEEKYHLLIYLDNESDPILMNRAIRNSSGQLFENLGNPRTH